MRRGNKDFAFVKMGILYYNKHIMSKNINKEIPKFYDASLVEDAIYKRWEESGFFNPDNLPGKRKEAFSISMPLPNATGILHIGHAMFLTIQDLVIRFQRMRGKKALWLPGTDHAAIATQTKVEKILQGEGKSKYDLGREKFLERVDEFVEGSQDTIRMQIRKMGSSCDWSRERFTLDAGLSEAVREAFVRMYNDGLIYRGERIVNWCPRCESTLADDEVEYKEEKAKFYYFKYGPVIIGTARPETKFLDKTIVVHPKDKRYKNLVGKKFMVDWIDGKIEANVIADTLVDMNFGSGAMTITPAHSFEDFDFAKKHKLPIVKIIDEKGNFTKVAGKFVGRNARSCREEIVEVLKTQGLLEKIDQDYIHNLSVCYRCSTPIEPLTKDQWWIDVNKKVKRLEGKSLKQASLDAVKSGHVRFVTKRFEKMYYYWMENLRDWCISRQIWYGHRIPVWYRRKSEIRSTKFEISPSPILSPEGRGEEVRGISKLETRNLDFHSEQEIYVGVEPPQGDGWEQDPDTLDTWFSSGLWTFSTLGWPAKTQDLKNFHPTSFMETGYDIIFFWVARMILMSLYHTREVPFHEVYLHGLVRDEKGIKMSKSLGNIIDPLDVCKKYGTDAVRLSLLIGNTAGNDLHLGEEKIAGFRNFTNKLWNISRFVLMTVKDVRLIEKMPKPKTLADRWILGKLQDLNLGVTKNFNEYNFSQAGEDLRNFTWNDFADWYLEIAKIEKDKDDILLYILQELLKMWHPFTPFVTEEIWKNFSKDLLMIASWPKIIPILEKNKEDKANAEYIISKIQSIIITLRNLKNNNNINIVADAMMVMPKADKELLNISDFYGIIEKLARVKLVDTLDTYISGAVGKIEIRLSATGVQNLNKEKIIRLIREKEEYIKSLQIKLNNKDFREKAPQQVIKKEKAKLANERAELAKLRSQFL